MYGTGKVSGDSPWIEAGSITAAEAALGVDERDVATADALDATKIIKIINQHPCAYAFLFRFRSDGTVRDTSNLELQVARGVDHYHRIGRLEISQGAQDVDGADIHFCDNVGLDLNDELFEGKTESLADRIGHYYVRTLGFDKFLFICSSLNATTTTIYVDYCPLYE